MPEFTLVLLFAFFGVATHILKKLVEEKTSTGLKMTPSVLRGFIYDYFIGNLLEMLLMLFLVTGALVIAYSLGELNLYAAYLTGFAGNSAGDVIGKRSMTLASRVAGQ
jgi:hypothetical protein